MDFSFAMIMDSSVVQHITTRLKFLNEKISKELLKKENTFGVAVTRCLDSTIMDTLQIPIGRLDNAPFSQHGGRH